MSFTINNNNTHRYPKFLLIISLLLFSLSGVNQTSAYQIDGTYQNLNGDPTPYTNFEGSYLLINAMQTFCQSCKDQHVELKIIYDKNISGVEILSLAVAVSDTVDTLNEFIIDYPTPWNAGVDIDLYAIETFSLSLTPTLMFFNPDGKMLFRNPGYAQAGAIEELIYRTMGITITNTDESTSEVNLDISDSTIPSSNTDPSKTNTDSESLLDFEYLSILPSFIFILIATLSFRKFKSRSL